jgi:hypothetical protein
VAKKVASELKIGLGLWVLTILVQEIIVSVRKMTDHLQVIYKHLLHKFVSISPLHMLYDRG